MLEAFGVHRGVNVAVSRHIRLVHRSVLDNLVLFDVLVRRTSLALL